MNAVAAVRNRLPLRVLLVLGAGCGLVAGLVLVRSVDGSALRDTLRHAASQPQGLALALAAFGAAFVLRALAWTRVLRGLSFGQSLAAIHVTLGANHVLPFRLGEPLRVWSVVRRGDVGLEAAAASTVTLRAADILAVMVLGLAVAPGAYLDLVSWVGWLMLLPVAVAALAGWRWLGLIVARRSDVTRPDAVALALSTGAWFLEAVLVWQTARWAGLDLSPREAVLVTTVAVAAQIAAFAPGGFGTYEAAAVAAYVTLGFDPGPALVAAVAAHGLKTAYALAAGAVGAVAPGPSLLGRLRLAPASIVRGDARMADDAPVVLLMPALNEAASVAECVRRAPAVVRGRPVRVLVIDDGSTDATASLARAAGAEVVAMGINQGLGAAVRRGLAESVALGAAAVAFCDADGEYPPEQLENMVGPILDGHADYVIGSRFAGHIEHMRPHRRFGNRVLTRILSLVARRRLTDGQSGYRALSPPAAAAAEIIHDFNYAQVLTLDLLAKGYRYCEVPISYRFRSSGESFIRLGPYLQHVVPAVYRELNSA